MNKIFIPILALVILASCAKDPEPGAKTNETALDIQLKSVLSTASNNNLNSFKLPASDDYISIPQDPKNPITKAKVDLGQLLFHETKLASAPKNAAGEFTFACSSCHHSQAGFQAGRFQGIADGGMGFGIAGEARVKDPRIDGDSLDVQPIRTPSTMNTAYQQVMLWNGQFGATGVNVGTEASWTVGTPKETNKLGFEGIETQAIAGLTVHRMKIDKKFCDDNNYTQMFNRAFPRTPIDKNFTTRNAGLAIAAYERTLLANEAPFQKWLDGEFTALTENQKEGAKLFFDVNKANCVSCHNGPALNSMTFHALGVKNLDGPDVFGPNGTEAGERLGRAGFTGKAEDEFKFKTPQLYNLIDNPFLGHGSSFSTVKDFVVYMNNGVKENSGVPDNKLSVEFKPLGLTTTEINQIVDFIENGLYDPSLSRYTPLAVNSGNCFPVADSVSRIDLNCN
ncbi:MAG: cytochrome c peroxidase [Sphingobacteriales bacterium]|jgi:cytochrome c peroxidase